jgi:hypothetical protein
MGSASDSTDQKDSFNSKLKAIATTADDTRFDQSELIACEKCLRANPPDRTACLYCGRPLSTEVIRADIAKINYRPPEPWESGYSLVYSGKDLPDGRAIESAADLLRLERDDLVTMLSIEGSVPLIYVRSLTDANILAAQLSQNKFDCAIAGDDLLQANTPPTRVRSIVLDRDEVLLQDFNTDKFSPVNVNDQVLIVIGSLLKTSTELKGKISKRVLKNAEESTAISDEAVVDIYPPNDFYGFRIRASGFDFSCLGERKQPIATANMATLIDELRSRFASGVFVESFAAAAPLIGDIWPLSESRVSSSVTRSTLGGIHKQKVTALDNNVQFTKFSRLQRHLR